MATTLRMSARRRRGSSTSCTPSLIAYAVAAVLGFLSPRLGITLYLLIAIYLAIPLRDVRKLFGRSA